MSQLTENPVSSPNAEPFVITESRDGVGLLTLNRPEKRNIFSREMMLAIKSALEDFRDDEAVRAVIVAAKGPVFSSGHDMGALVGAPEEEVRNIFGLSTEIMQGLQSLPLPVIAQVDGLASAAGCQFVVSCDLVMASPESRFQTPGVKIGLFCSTPMVPLSRAIHPKKALEMLLTGEPISAEEARLAGMVNRIVPSERLAEETFALARQIIQYSSYTLGLGKEAFYKQLPLDPGAAYDTCKQIMIENALAPDGQEGMSAFLEKRKPQWKK